MHSFLCWNAGVLASAQQDCTAAHLMRRVARRAVHVCGVCEVGRGLLGLRGYARLDAVAAMD
jgi:hypothetical protein